jgi:hypothetical protein
MSGDEEKPWLTTGRSRPWAASVWVLLARALPACRVSENSSRCRSGLIPTGRFQARRGTGRRGEHRAGEPGESCVTGPGPRASRSPSLGVSDGAPGLNPYQHPPARSTLGRLDTDRRPGRAARVVALKVDVCADRTRHLRALRRNLPASPSAWRRDDAPNW